MNALTRAIEQVHPQTQAELARRINVTPQEVNRWVRRGWAAPRYAPAIEHATGIPCRDLVADIPSHKST